MWPWPTWLDLGVTEEEKTTEISHREKETHSSAEVEEREGHTRHTFISAMSTTVKMGNGLKRT